MKPGGNLKRTPFPAPVNPDGTLRWSSLTPGGPLQRHQEMPRGKGLRSSGLSVVDGAGPSVLVLRPRQRRKDTIPEKVRDLVHERDEHWCQHCGRQFPEGGIHQHHRRLKQQGGDKREHTDCCCNLISLCWACHGWLHDTAEGRRKAKSDGFIIPNAATEPGLHRVRVQGELGGGISAWLTCEGGRGGCVYVKPEGGFE